jgi:hypothetical protein
MLLLFRFTRRVGARHAHALKPLPLQERNTDWGAHWGVALGLPPRMPLELARTGMTLGDSWEVGDGALCPAPFAHFTPYSQFTPLTLVADAGRSTQLWWVPLFLTLALAGLDSICTACIAYDHNSDSARTGCNRDDWGQLCVLRTGLPSARAPCMWPSRHVVEIGACWPAPSTLPTCIGRSGLGILADTEIRSFHAEPPACAGFWFMRTEMTGDDWGWCMLACPIRVISVA